MKHEIRCPDCGRVLMTVDVTRALKRCGEARCRAAWRRVAAQGDTITCVPCGAVVGFVADDRPGLGVRPVKRRGLSRPASARGGTARPAAS